ncbi:hypothetical protein ACH47Z_41630 [Streptomyces sp. NPDC020192]|uniref:hypothetical protein n=1 Tax=Streptomyces sp. NPDC020192 TaxID=3365066 RepID=UPI00379846A4
MRVHGRLDDVEVIGGRNVVPGEVERLLETHPRVFEAAVSAVRRPAGDTSLRAYVVPVPSTASDAGTDGDTLAAEPTAPSPVPTCPGTRSRTTARGRQWPSLSRASSTVRRSSLSGAGAPRTAVAPAAVRSASYSGGMRAARENIGALVTAEGIAAALPSLWQTVTHITDDTYRVPEVRHGKGHVQYHMARETLITAGALGTVAIGVLRGRGAGARCGGGWPPRRPGFTAAMWSGGPTTGVWAPNRTALALHAASTTGLTAGILLLCPREAGR